MFSKTLSLDITRPYNLLISESISKFPKRKAKTTSRTLQLILTYTEVHFYLNSWTKFLLNNCQPSKALGFIRNRKKITNRKPPKLPKAQYLACVSLMGLDKQNLSSKCRSSEKNLKPK